MTGLIEQRLEQIRARVEPAPRDPWGAAVDMDTADLVVLLTEVDRLRALIGAVDRIHREYRVVGPGKSFCSGCYQVWPCSTHVALGRGA